ncbi:MAG: GAF domain-containing sensor histidine kinase [Chloroflexi bacterium]|nr:GAF domain-containing sensor histidine kinase [Chloroflexota bacterium]MBU1747496.1 GAF domain-containing sensor histidine kinase [Chloroflexota bacterium]
MSLFDDSTDHLLALTRFLTQLATANLIRETLVLALDEAMRFTGSPGGIVLFMGQEPAHIQRGIVEPAPAAQQIETWESLVRQRLTQGEWRIASAVKPNDLSFVTTTLVSAFGPTLLNAPLLAEDRVVGTINLIVQDPEIPLLTRQMLALLVRAVGATSVEIERRLLMRQGFSHLDTLHKVGQVLGGTLELHTLLNEIMRLTSEVMEAEASSLWLIDEKAQELVFEYAHGGQREALRQYRMPMDQGIAGWVATHNEPVLSNNVSQDERFNQRVDVRTGYLTHSILCVPLRIKGKAIGVLQVLNRLDDEGFTESDLNLLNILAAEAAISIENARLYRSLREERDRIVMVGEDVRRELARSLHDGPAQALAAINMRLDFIRKLLERDPQRAASEIQDLERMVSETTRDVRNLLFELRPIVLEAQGLRAAIESFVGRLWRVGKRPMFHLQLDIGDERFGPSTETTVFAVAQEAINNALRHADADNIIVHLRQEQSDLVATVRDDGLGFRVSTVESGYERRGSFGLLNMRERADMMNGSLSIHAAPGKGTEVTLRIPL